MERDKYRLAELEETNHLLATLGDLNLDTEALLIAIHAADDELTKEWKSQGALQQWKGQRNSPAVELVNDIVEHTSESWWVRYNPNTGDEPTIRVHWKALSRIEATEDLLAEIADGEDRKTDLIESAIADTIYTVGKRVVESRYTEREFLAFHLGTSYSVDQTASIMTQILDSDQSSGAVRKYQSRAADKLKLAHATLDVMRSPEPKQVSELPSLEARLESPLDDETKTALIEGLHRKIYFTDKHSRTNVTASPTENITLDFNFMGDQIESFIHIDTAEIDRTVYVDEIHDGNISNVERASSGKELTSLADLSASSAALVDDIHDILDELFPPQPQQSMVFSGTESGWTSTQALADSNEGGGVISFIAFIDMPKALH
ncbi:hypothetical protein [Halosimplex pelagicum]|uniref:Uncharacterized protein n=1 Tax=Halosimplex pelagicum TaxID=869886 RepID=A0A7D5P6T3_9EURY|nr:hypothetical protein [Halosimplex pelagicum]QLH82277.1 hypothetical protein HZS54_11930 [Halosimplex pelagicum]